MMNILFLTNKVPYPPKDGGSIASFGLIGAMAKAGHAVTVLAMNTRKHHVTPYEFPEQVTSKIIFHLVEVPANINVFAALRNMLFSRKPYNAERFIDKKFRLKLQLLLESHRYDMVQLEGFYLCPYISTIRRYSNAKITYRSHNIEHEIWERTVAQTKGIKKFYIDLIARRLKKFEISFINQYDLLVPITERDEQQLNNMGNTKPSLVIPAGFDFDEAVGFKEDFKHNLFFIGALDWIPNQEGLTWFLENCWDQILMKRPDTELKIAGRNAPAWFVEVLKKQNIDYFGEIDDARQFIAENGIMIAPLLSGSGMRVKLIEGMCCRKAIVTTPVGCEGIPATNEKEIFIAPTAVQFIEYVLILLNNRQKIVDTGNNAFTFVKVAYNNIELNKRLVAFYNQHL